MKVLVLLLAAVSIGHAQTILRPDPAKTPGAIDPALTKNMLCDRSFHTGTIRNVPRSEKVTACLAYGIASGCPGPGYELDHLVSLELGGKNDISNLWPQGVDGPGVIGFHAKDKVENAAHKAVCEGKLALWDAQQSIARDWYALGMRLGVFK